MNSSISCPHCKKTFPLNEVITHELEEGVERKYEAKREKEREEEREKMRLWQEKREKELILKLEQDRKFEREESERKDKLITEFRENELTLRKKTQELGEKERNLELESQRRIDDERKKIREKTEEEVTEKFHLKEKEKDSIIDGLKKSLEEAQRRANQGSQQLQGEIMELELEEILRREFPVDEISEVKKGKDGADIVQKVRNNLGKVCGVIVWESKRTKSFSQEWIAKLKENILLVKGDLGVIVSEVLPKNVKMFGFTEGVYIAGFDYAFQIAQVLRKSIIDLENMRSLSVGKNEKIESLYRYITSSEFAQKIESMMETYLQMQQELETEKNAIQKIWAKREARIEKLKNNTIQIHGSLSGMIDAPMPEVKSLSFSELDILIEERS